MLDVCVFVCLCVCLSAEPRLQARRISLLSEGHALYSALSSLVFFFVLNSGQFYPYDTIRYDRIFAVEN